jgi:hypothetical protein
MKAPFPFERVVLYADIIDREDDVDRLESNLVFSVNIVITSPRQWGKS